MYYESQQYFAELVLDFVPFSPLSSFPSSMVRPLIILDLCRRRSSFQASLGNVHKLETTNVQLLKLRTDLTN